MIRKILIFWNHEDSPGSPSLEGRCKSSDPYRQLEGYRSDAGKLKVKNRQMKEASLFNKRSGVAGSMCRPILNLEEGCREVPHDSRFVAGDVAGVTVEKGL